MRKNIIYNILLSLTNILFPLISFVYVARILGPKGIGEVQFVMSFAQYFSIFAAIGIPIYGVREIAKVRDSPAKLSSTFLSLSTLFFLTSVIMTLIYFLIVFIHPYFSNNQPYYIVAGILVFLSFSYTDWYYTGIEAFHKITIRSIVIKLIALALLYTFVKTSDDIFNYLWISIFSILGNQVYNFVDIYFHLDIKNPVLNFKPHIKPLLLIFGATIASSIYTLWDTIILYFLTTPEIVGYYTVSTRLTKLIIPVITAVGGALIPTITYHYSNQQIETAKSFIKSSLDVTIFTTIPVTVGLMALAPELIDTFAGEAFKPGIVTMQIMSLLPIVIGIGHLLSFQLLIPFGQNKAVFVSMLIGFAVSITANLVLIPMFLDKGAAISAVITETIVCAAYYYHLSAENKFKIHYNLLYQTVISSLVFVPIIMGVRMAFDNPIVICILSIFTCVIAYSILQFFVFKNIGVFKSIIQKRTQL
jgi:O-antigen/teichoic acid export membrane protein